MHRESGSADRVPEQAAVCDLIAEVAKGDRRAFATLYHQTATRAVVLLEPARPFGTDRRSETRAALL